MMKNYLTITLLSASAFLMSCSGSADKTVASAKLFTTADNKEIGTAKFYQLADGKMKMDLEIDYPKRGDSTVAVHFHEHGDCSNMGENTHGHWNPTKEAHGKWGSAAYHSGDIGNIQLDGKGHGSISVTTDRWSIDTDNIEIYWTWDYCPRWYRRLYYAAYRKFGSKGWVWNYHN